MKQQVAGDLKYSGLFEKFKVFPYPDNQYYIWLDADQAEAVLEEMKVQVAKQDGWFLCSSELGGCIPDDLAPDYDEADPFSGIGLDQRILADNAILAWFTKHAGWKPELQSALERLGWV